MNYSVSIESLQKNFPVDFQVPSLMLEFGRWLSSRTAGGLGYFSLHSERFNDYWIENGADLHANFAFFIRDPTGGQIGYWLYDGRKTVSAPIALVGSEGELSILGETLNEFLDRLAAGNTQVPDLDSRDGDKLGAQLAKWLKSHSVSLPVSKHRDYPDFKEWMGNWGKQQREWIDKDPLHLQIADKLRKFVEPNAEPWETANFDVLLVGTQFQMWHRSFGLKPLPRADESALEDLFRAVREQRARKVPERGLWFSAWVKVGSEGGASLCCNFMDEPQFLDEKPTIPASDYKLDLSAFPRSQHWTPEWFA